MKVVVISASPRKIAKTQVFMKYVTEYVKNSSLDGLEVKLLNPALIHSILLDYSYYHV